MLRTNLLKVAAVFHKLDVIPRSHVECLASCPPRSQLR